jgi:hypothetical protein
MRTLPISFWPKKTPLSNTEKEAISQPPHENIFTEFCRRGCEEMMEVTALEG